MYGKEVYKPGPRDIGIMKGWKPADYGIDLKKNESFLKERTTSASRKRTMSGGPGASNVYKPGPRDIGRNKDWKPANYGIDLKEEQSTSFLKERTSSRSRSRTKRTQSATVYKPGPRDIGRNRSYKAPDYGIDLNDTSDFLADRVGRSRSGTRVKRTQSSVTRKSRRKPSIVLSSSGVPPMPKRTRSTPLYESATAKSVQKKRNTQASELAELKKQNEELKEYVENLVKEFTTKSTQQQETISQLNQTVEYLKEKVAYLVSHHEAKDEDGNVLTAE